MADDHWQTKCLTISERTRFIFNNELLSDVKFIVPVSISESESQKMIPAHKFVLAIGSPVFCAMFFGEMAETENSIELPDCEYESLLELFRYLYTDEVNLTGSNVMHVLYLAKKYTLPSLADKCSAYLHENLGASNVFSILPHAKKFDDRICFTVNKDIHLIGVGHFGHEGGTYTVRTQLIDTVSGSCVASKSGVYSSEEKHQEITNYYGFTVLFDDAVPVKKNNCYEVVSLVKGDPSWYGDKGKRTVQCFGVICTFSNSKELADNNYTDVDWGQFPTLLFEAVN